MPTTVSLSHTLNQGPTMHQQSTLFDTPALSGHSYFAPSSPSKQHKQRRSVSSFASRRSSASHSSSSSENDDDDEDSIMNRPSLHQILINQGRGQYTLDNFGAFLQSQFCYENLAFWLASRQYKLCAQSLYQSVQSSAPLFTLHADTAHHLNQSQARAFSDLQNKMRAILETFVLPSSPHELNLSDAVRCRLLRLVAEGDYHPQVAEEAREAIMDLMKCSSYPMFIEGIAAKRASNAGSAQSATSTSSSSQQDSHHHHHGDGSSGSWRNKAKHHFKLVSKMLKRHP
ncbi:MAG: RGS domain-containing protein [Linnemannia gamsii]|nr:MAG: RGS domain-containing protein [Linnemannia gamsii]